MINYTVTSKSHECYNMFNKGANVGDIPVAGYSIEEGSWCHGYICGFNSVCNYALRSRNSCYCCWPQKIAPSVW